MAGVCWEASALAASAASFMIALPASIFSLKVALNPMTNGELFITTAFPVF